MSKRHPDRLTRRVKRLEDRQRRDMVMLRAEIIRMFVRLTGHLPDLQRDVDSLFAVKHRTVEQALADGKGEPS